MPRSLSGLHSSRRDFLKTSAASATAAGLFTFPFSMQLHAGFTSLNEKPTVGIIGAGGRMWGLINESKPYVGYAAVCDVDQTHLAHMKGALTENNKKSGVNAEVDAYEDYQKVLERNDINAVIIATPDHWHTKIAIEAMKSGKDVYCEKPLTLTIEEGRQILKVLKETGRVFQVGTQQRTDFNQRFVKAVAALHKGGVGKIKRVTVVIGGGQTSPELPVVPVPSVLNWDKWLGQAPYEEYVQGDKPDSGYGQESPRGRTHQHFRWWYEYSGGKMTDWGAHHIDIAMWGLDRCKPGQGPNMIEVLEGHHPVPYVNGCTTVKNRFNVADSYHIKCSWEDGVELHIRSDWPEEKIGNGIKFEGDKGSLFVSRGELKGDGLDAVDEDAIATVWKGKTPTTHMVNFLDCIKTRETPISDVESHHYALSIGHLANIALRFNRNLTWNPQSEQIVGDPQANAFQAREQRKGYEIMT